MGIPSSSSWNLTIVTSIAELSFLRHNERDWFKQLAAQAAGQTLQCGQVLDLEVVQGDVAVLDCAAVEFTEEFLKDVVDADARQKVALLNVAVQWFWDETFVAGGIKIERFMNNFFQ